MPSPLHPNHAFLVDFVVKSFPAGRVLDYGCGSGEVVSAGADQGLNIFGCESFYDHSNSHEWELPTGCVEMAGDLIPFPAEYFDCVVSNMVFEHIRNLDVALSEISRVLKPGGTLLSQFPTSEVVYENHCGVPLAHKLTGTRFGYYWLLGWRSLGLGKLKENKTRREWAAHYHDWIKTYCFYRSEHEILAALENHGFAVARAEKSNMRFRRRTMPVWLFKRLLYVVLCCKKL